MIESWPYVSKRLHLIWLPNDHPGWRVPAFWSVVAERDVVACYRLTPTVYVWFCMALQNDSRKSERGVEVIVPEWEVITDWASQHFESSEIDQARRAPRIELPEPIEDWKSLQAQDVWMERAGYRLGTIESVDA